MSQSTTSKASREPRSRRTTITYLAAALLGLTIPIAVVIGRIGSETDLPPVADHVAHPTQVQTLVPLSSTPAASPSHDDSHSPGEITDEAEILAEEVSKAATATATPEPTVTESAPGSIAAATHAPSHGETTPSATASAEPTHAHHPSPSTPAAVAGGNPVDCSGYPEPRTMLQIHVWWEGDPQPADHIAHLHSEVCFPLGQRVSGVVRFDTRIVVHDTDAQLYRFEDDIFDSGLPLQVIGMDETCGINRTCEYWVTTYHDTTKGPDGWFEFRSKPRVRFSNGDVMLTSGGWPLFIDNGNSANGERSSMGPIVGRGWYDQDRGYQNPVFRGPGADVLPGATVSGQWTIDLALDKGSGGSTPTATSVWADTDWHHFQEDTDGGGVLLGAWDGPYRGPLTIDTTKLSNGPHMLILRVEDDQGPGRLVGLQYVAFNVRN